jgi:mono/diheme cytochrome c family protein
LLRLNAVVGIIGKVNKAGHVVSIGTTCALCHSTVDDSFASGIGKRLDGWPNRDLNVGAILGLSPALSTALKAEFSTWGPGKYDPRHHVFDGTNIILLNTPTLPVLIPPAYGLAGVGFETYTGDGSISYWNNYVGVSQMGGQGNFSDPRIGLMITQRPDLVTPKLPALLEYQLSLEAPAPPAASFDAGAARRGERVFHGKAQCATCHIPPTYTDVLSGPEPTVPFLHDADEVGTDPTYAERSATRRYRTTPLRGVWQHPPYFHDGRADTLLEVVDHYDQRFQLNLSPRQKADLVEFLKSL